MKSGFAETVCLKSLPSTIRLFSGDAKSLAFENLWNEEFFTPQVARGETRELPDAGQRHHLIMNGARCSGRSRRSCVTRFSRIGLTSPDSSQVLGARQAVPRQAEHHFGQARLSRVGGGGAEVPSLQGAFDAFARS